MSRIHKVIFIVLITLIIIFVFVLIDLPVFTDNSKLVGSINVEKQKNSELESKIEWLVSIKEEYHNLNAAFQKYSTELPDETDMSVLTDEIYNVAKYAGVEIYSLDFIEIEEPREKEKDEKESFGIIGVNLILEGSYYKTLSFLNTLEVMPRITKIKDIMMQSTEEDYENLTAYVVAEVYFDKTTMFEK